MTYVEFSHQNSSGVGRSVTVDATVNCTWNLPAVGQAGSATITLPADSTALNTDYISEDGGSWVKIYGDAGLGEWRGIIEQISEQQGQTIITASEWWVLLQRIPVQVNRTFIHVTPAVVVKWAFSATPWELVSAAESEPNIPRYTFLGEAVWDHVARMMDLSGQELYYDDDHTWRWGTQRGDYTRAVLVAPYDISTVSKDTRSSDMAAQVTVISGNDWYIARGNDLPTPAHAVIKDTLTPNQMAVRAENELIRRSQPMRSLTGTLERHYWTIGLGDAFGVFVPWAGLGAGRLQQCRVVSKQFDSQRYQLTTRLQILSPQQITGVPTGLGGSSFVKQVREQKRRQEWRRRWESGDTA